MYSLRSRVDRSVAAVMGWWGLAAQASSLMFMLCLLVFVAYRAVPSVGAHDRYKVVRTFGGDYVEVSLAGWLVAALIPIAMCVFLSLALLLTIPASVESRRANACAQSLAVVRRISRGVMTLTLVCRLLVPLLIIGLCAGLYSRIPSGALLFQR